jgi:hypothetical protein
MHIGMRDLEVYQFDVRLLGEWFTIKRSLAAIIIITTIMMMMMLFN